MDEASILIDFSIAIVQDVDETMHGLSRAAGSFDYMPPEQVIGYADPSSDIYSLARLVIEMLTGRRLSQLLPAASLDLSARVPDLLRSLNIRLSEESVSALASALSSTLPTARTPQPNSRHHSLTTCAGIEPLTLLRAETLPLEQVVATSVHAAIGFALVLGSCPFLWRFLRK